MVLGTDPDDAPNQVSSSSSLDSIAALASNIAQSKRESMETQEDATEVVSADGFRTTNNTDQQSLLNHPLLLPTTNGVVASAAIGPATIALNGSVPEFLFQLMKMLTDDNREIIEWSNGRIEVHSPLRLETTVLSRYFRHSKFASFQRQLNYFGFRKLAGKGKMSPCSYVNENVRGDLSNLLLIKRKSGPSSTAKETAITKKQKRSKSPPAEQTATAPIVNPVLADIVRSSSRRRSPRKLPANTPAGVIARQAVGKGVRHGYVAPAAAAAAQTTADESGGAFVNLAELESNYRISLNTAPDNDNNDAGDFPAFLAGESLVDLAIIPQPSNSHEGGVDTFNFVDFPHPEVDPLSCLDDVTPISSRDTKPSPAPG